MKRFSLLGLVLVGASAVTAAVLPSNTPVANNGKLVASTGGAGNQKTCIATQNNPVCTATVPVSAIKSETTTAGDGGSGTALTNGSSENRFSSLVGEDDAFHSSGSPV